MGVTRGCSAAISLKAHLIGKAKQELWREVFWLEKGRSHVIWLKKNAFAAINKSLFLIYD
jgi:hypothetical protein